MEPAIFNFPIMNAIVGSCVPFSRPWKVSVEQVSVTSASLSSLDTAAGVWVESIKTQPSSPRSILILALMSGALLTLVAMFLVMSSKFMWRT